MRYIDLILANPMTWGLFLFYLLGTGWLAWLGHKKTTDIESFAVGNGDMSPWIVGVTLAASIASVATFVINPGFVYVHGLAAFMHFGVAASAGVILGLVLMSAGFRRVGAKYKAITLPQWIGQRYGSKAMTVFFAAVNLLSVAFMVLIVGGLSEYMSATLGLTKLEGTILIIAFVYSYIMLGGTYAHAYTNTLQGAIMVVVSVIIVVGGLHLFSDGLLTKVEAVSPDLVAWVNPKSSLFGDFWTVYVSGFVVGFAVVCQPHILTKALYVKTDKQVYQYLAVAIGVSLIFTALLLVGFYAHALGIQVPPQKQNIVMALYVAQTFSPAIQALITVALLAAGMSTLDGILVAMSSIAANDLFLKLTENNLLKNKTHAQKSAAAHKASQYILIGLGMTTFLILWLFPPGAWLGIFGQIGIYGILAASLVPITFGIYAPHAQGRPIFAAAGVGVAVHFTLCTSAYMSPATGAAYGFSNPGVAMTWAVIASTLTALPFALKKSVAATS
jgi:sodium/pantothenate symporter